MVGDIVLIHENDFFPVDLIVVSSSLEKGVCYIETASLDGEKNLKPKMAIPETINYFSQDHVGRVSGRINGQTPNSMLGQFEGKSKFDFC